MFITYDYSDPMTYILGIVFIALAVLVVWIHNYFTD